mgnify:CR=1 FL=1
MWLLPLVHVSIVNWVKGAEEGQKKLFRQIGDDVNSPWEVDDVDRIGAALSGRFDVTQAADLNGFGLTTPNRESFSD